MKLEYDLITGKEELETRTLHANEKLILATPCLLKNQELWFNELLLAPNSRLRFSLNAEAINKSQMTTIFAPLLLSAQNFRSSLEFLNWWMDLLKLDASTVPAILSKLKKLGVGQGQLDTDWKDLSFHHRMLLILVPAGERGPLVHLLLGDYFIEAEDQVSFTNQLMSWLGMTPVHLFLFWSYTLRDVKATKLFFNGFKEEKL